MNTSEIYTEVPSHLQQLVRLVVHGYYSIEDALIVDMLVRNPCMKEDDMCDLLKFERKMLRARMATLRSDKFIQVRLKMETGADGKAQKVNYYFIDYKMFVNVVKYKLDHMRKKLETEERDATSRASFKCPNCQKAFTDLEADQLFDPLSQEYYCTFCRSIVEEDQSALPKKDSRLMLARFNEQMEPLYELLRRVEGIKLAPELLDPEPTDISVIRGEVAKHTGRPVPPSNNFTGEGVWSGEATRSHGFQVEEAHVDIAIGDEGNKPTADVRKERPVWMVESTIAPETQLNASVGAASNTPSVTDRIKREEDIMNVLLANERKADQQKAVIPGQSESEDNDSDSSVGDTFDAIPVAKTALVPDEIIITDMSDEDDIDEEKIPTVSVNGKRLPITDVIRDVQLTQQMTVEERVAYNLVYCEFMPDMF